MDTYYDHEAYVLKADRTDRAVQAVTARLVSEAWPVAEVIYINAVVRVMAAVSVENGAQLGDALDIVSGFNEDTLIDASPDYKFELILTADTYLNEAMEVSA